MSTDLLRYGERGDVPQALADITKITGAIFVVERADGSRAILATDALKGVSIAGRANGDTLVDLTFRASDLTDDQTTIAAIDALLQALRGDRAPQPEVELRRCIVDYSVKAGALLAVYFHINTNGWRVEPYSYTIGHPHGIATRDMRAGELVMYSPQANTEDIAINAGVGPL